MSDEREVRDHALSRIYREGAWPEPSRQIDQAILAASRRSARDRHPLLWRWAPPFAVAATVVLTSAIVLKAYREQPETVAPGAMEYARAKQSAPEPKAEAKPAPPTAPAPAPQTVTTPQGFTSTMDAGEAARLERAQQDIGFKDVTPPVANQAPAKAAPAAKAPPALKKEEPARADALQPQRRADAPQTPAAGGMLSVFGAQTPTATPPAPTPPAATQASRAVGKPATPFTQNAPQAAPPAPAGAPPQGQAPPAVPAEALKSRPEPTQAVIPGVGTVAAQVETRSPQAWLDDIRKLVKEGKSEEAGQEIARFKKRYPDYALPEDLR